MFNTGVNRFCLISRRTGRSSSHLLPPCFKVILTPALAIVSHVLENTFFILFAVMGLGMALGRITVFGLSLGSSGVLFTALLAGHFGLQIPGGIGTFGLVLFVYAVGIGAGGRFFSALVHQGTTMAKLALTVVVLGATVAWGSGRMLDLPPDLMAGIFAGALTSTPALAAATDYLKEAGDLVPIGYGIAYPFGIIGVVIFVQLLPRLLKVSFEEPEEAGSENGEEEIRPILVEVTHDEFIGRRIADLEDIAALGCQVTRIEKEGRLVPLEYDDELALGQKLLVVGRESKVHLAVKLLGRESEASLSRDTDRERRQLLLTSKAFSGKSIRELELLRHHGVTISRISRLGFTFVPDRGTVLDANDLLTVVGTPSRLEAFAQAIGHRPQGFQETDLLSLGAGLAIGILVGQLSLGLPGGAALSLGLAGGPLLTGLILGHFGRVGWIIGYIPRPTRILLQELGLVLFLAEAGVRGGGAFVDTLQTYGPVLFLLGAVITLLPLMGGYIVARGLFRLSLLQSLGGICGGMTSTPALGVITAKTENQTPVVSYATAYPVALILMTVFAKGLIQILGG